MWSVGKNLFPKDAICTYTGRVFRPLDPDPEQIDIMDIAHSLANQCRWTGHVKKFFSTAQHSVRVSELCPDELQLCGLLHDATEAYISDIARPVKRFTDWGQDYEAIEQKLWEAIAERFSLPLTLPTAVKEADDLVLFAEMRDLMPPYLWEREGFKDTLPAAEQKIKPWTPSWSKAYFLMRYEKLSEVAVSA